MADVTLATGLLISGAPVVGKQERRGYDSSHRHLHQFEILLASIGELTSAISDLSAKIEGLPCRAALLAGQSIRLPPYRPPPNGLTLRQNEVLKVIETYHDKGTIWVYPRDLIRDGISTGSLYKIFGVLENGGYIKTAAGGARRLLKRADGTPVDRAAQPAAGPQRAPLVSVTPAAATVAPPALTPTVAPLNAPAAALPPAREPTEEIVDAVDLKPPPESSVLVLVAKPVKPRAKPKRPEPTAPAPVLKPEAEAAAQYFADRVKPKSKPGYGVGAAGAPGGFSMVSPEEEAVARRAFERRGAPFGGAYDTTKV